VTARALDAFLPAVFVTTVIELAAARGASRTALLAASGALAADLSSPEKLLPAAAVLATWAAAMRAHERLVDKVARIVDGELLDGSQMPRHAEGRWTS
jgi:hypothetical protein